MKCSALQSKDDHLTHLTSKHQVLLLASGTGYFYISSSCVNSKPKLFTERRYPVGEPVRFDYLLLDENKLFTQTPKVSCSACAIKQDQSISSHLSFQLCFGIHSVTLTQALQLLSVFHSLAQARQQVKSFARLCVCFLFQLHGVTPGSLCIHQNQQQVPTGQRTINEKVITIKQALPHHH